VVEQRYRAVLEVLEEGLPVTEVVRRYGVARQTVHEWLSRYAGGGLAGLVDRSSRPASCPHQMPPEVEARIAGMRREHPGWGPSRILWELERAGVTPPPRARRLRQPQGPPPPQELRYRECRLGTGTHLSPGYPNLT
jgi:transposase-like protein